MSNTPDFQISTPMQFLFSEKHHLSLVLGNYETKPNFKRGRKHEDHRQMRSVHDLHPHR